MGCENITPPNRRICIGSLNKLIILNTRDLTEPVGGSTDYTELFTLVQSVWANMKTVKGATAFDGTGTLRVVTHEVVIRYLDGITSENWIEFNNDYYQIIDTENIDEKDKWLILSCYRRGDKTIPINQQ